MNDQQLREEYEVLYGANGFITTPTSGKINVYAYKMSFEDFKQLTLS